MPWVQIAEDKLEHLPILGYDKIAEDDALIWYATPHGRMCVEKSDPRVYFEDVNDAMQFSPKAVFAVGQTEQNA